MTEIFVGLFKRIGRRGLATDKVLTRISQNLSFLRENWENLQLSSGLGGRHGKSKKKKAFYQELEACLVFFTDKQILAGNGGWADREVTDVFAVDKKLCEKKIARLHGSLTERVIIK
jgi:hypothetical protein